MSDLEVLDTLIKLCHPLCYMYPTIPSFIEALQKEDFTTTPLRKVHDWRNYIPRELQPIWSELSTQTMLMAFFFAEGKADDEEWD